MNAPNFVGVARFAVIRVGDDARLIDLVTQCVERVRAECGPAFGANRATTPLGLVPLRDPWVEVLVGPGGVASLVGNTRGLLAFRDALDQGGFEGHGEICQTDPCARCHAGDAWRILRGAVDDAIEGAS